MISKNDELPTANVLPTHRLLGYSSTCANFRKTSALFRAKFWKVMRPYPVNHAYVIQSSRWHPEMMLSASGGFLHVCDPAWHAEFTAADIGEYGDALANLRVGRIAETHA